MDQCVAKHREGATIICMTQGCRETIHLVCCEEVMRAVKRVPRLKSNTIKIQSLADKLASKEKMKIVTTMRRTWKCFNCRKS